MAEKPIYVRAKPASLRINEHYFYEKKISKNPSIGQTQAPRGRIEIIVPYDGDQYFTRQAYNDVKKQLSGEVSGNNLDSIIGYLAFTNNDQTNLSQTLNLNEHYGSFPLRIPIFGQGIKNIEQLYSDRIKCTVIFDYLPQPLSDIPVDVELELWDEDILPSTEMHIKETEEQLAFVASQIAQQVNFHRNLLIKSRIKIDLPSALLSKEVKPKVVRLELGWPTITSFRGLHLGIGASPRDKEVHVMYNPQTSSLQWGNIPMNLISQSFDTDYKSFFTDWMYLLTDYPGELYQQSYLEGEVEIEVPGLLLSRSQARFFNVLGEQKKEYVPKVVSRVNVKFKLFLDEAFAKRTLSPYQHLYFDEVIPDEMRIADIKTAIVDRGFGIIQDESLSTHEEIRHLIKAERSEGPDTMSLSMFIEGRRHKTERETQITGGQKFRSDFESGELKVYMRGEMPGDSRSLIHEMNGLQTALHERFGRLRAKR